MSAKDRVEMPGDWRTSLPVLSGRAVSLREPSLEDVGSLVDLLSVADATTFGLDEPPARLVVQGLVERLRHERDEGRSFAYIVAIDATRAVVGLYVVRQLDPTFEGGEWECTLAPSIRGSGLFVETARLVASFAFDVVGARRLEARVLRPNGRGNGALRKLGAVQEGVLRRSIRRGDQYFDQVLWSILKEDWTERRLTATSRVH
jgi:RimJ/RimL family protein N-acetyltransferase